jgi:hypothetical protein
VRSLGLEFIHVEPEVCLGIKLYLVGIAQDAILREATADVPQSGGEGVACLTLWSVTPEQTGQPIPGLGSVAMEDQVSQQRLGFEGGRLGQRLIVIADV